jgi:anti-anti-sigma factor
MGLEITHNNYQSVPVLQLTGSLMDTDAFMFSRELRNLIKTGHTQVGIDISQLEYIDSHGLGLIVYHSNTLQKEQRQLIVYNTNPDPESYINRLINSTNLHIALNIVSG